MKKVVQPNRERAEGMKNRLFWRLRDSMFAMDQRGEAFTHYIAERVCKYSPKGLKQWYPYLLAKLVQELGEVLGYCFDLDECKHAIKDELLIDFI